MRSMTAVPYSDLQAGPPSDSLFETAFGLIRERAAGFHTVSKSRRLLATPALSMERRQ